MLSRWSGELHHFASGHYFKRAYCRCELEQKLAAFEEKLGLFYFSGGGNCEDVESDPLQCQRLSSLAHSTVHSTPLHHAVPCLHGCGCGSCSSSGGAELSCSGLSGKSNERACQICRTSQWQMGTGPAATTTC